MFARVAVLAAVGCAAAAGAPVAYADPGDGVALNGTFTVFSDGAWAKTNDSSHDERSVTQTWTIESTCSTYQDCTGHVTSDQGWSADLVYLSGRWKVTHSVPDWERCADGTAFPGEQTFTFWTGYPDPALIGWDSTLGPSGACGKNKQLNIRMPLRLTPRG